MKKKLMKFIYNLNYKNIMRNIILLESNPDYCDNTKGVFDELLNEKINKKYKLIWLVNNKNEFKDINISNVYFYNRNKSLFDKIRYIYLNFFSKYIIDCNNYIFKKNKNQFRIHLTHGTPIKDATKYCSQVGQVDYIIQISDFFTEITSKLFKIDKSKIISTGFPRNDIYFKNEKYYFFNDIKRKKTIVWFPTYRNHKYFVRKKNIELKSFSFGLPVINTQEELENINNLLKKENIVILIKFHPAEDISRIKNINLENIKIIDDDIFKRKHNNLYDLLNTSDALITDYSSVYYDYLLTNKPIGLAISDLDEYKKHNSLIFNNYKENIYGYYINNVEQLKTFIKNVSNNNDTEKELRKEAIKKYHKYIDGNSSKRVVKLLLDKMKEDE